MGLFCNTWLYGVNTALETFVSQAYGRDDLRGCGQYMHRAMFLSTLIFVPVAILLCHTEWLLILLGMDPGASELAALYVKYQIPGLLIHCYADSINLMLAAMGYTFVIVISQVVMIPLHLLFCYFLIYYWSYGVVGAAIATNLTAIFSFIV